MTSINCCKAALSGTPPITLKRCHYYAGRHPSWTGSHRKEKSVVSGYRYLFFPPKGPRGQELIVRHICTSVLCTAYVHTRPMSPLIDHPPGHFHLVPRAGKKPAMRPSRSTRLPTLLHRLYLLVYVVAGRQFRRSPSFLLSCCRKKLVGSW